MVKEVEKKVLQKAMAEAEKKGKNTLLRLRPQVREFPQPLPLPDGGSSGDEDDREGGMDLAAVADPDDEASSYGVVLMYL